ncbi:MAG: hypothetical protein DHS20C12_29570 [Pseudohongiella sp.]|nr:MAG: hypothetical protein DHS20C12_29570 [Pseudohongiella sp.]
MGSTSILPKALKYTFHSEFIAFFCCVRYGKVRAFKINIPYFKGKNLDVRHNYNGNYSPVADGLGYCLLLHEEGCQYTA